MPSSAFWRARDLLEPSIIAPAGNTLRVAVGWLGLGNVPESGGNHGHFFFKGFAAGGRIRRTGRKKGGQALIKPACVNCAFPEISVGENFLEESCIRSDSRDLHFFEGSLDPGYGFFALSAQIGRAHV